MSEDGRIPGEPIAHVEDADDWFVNLEDVAQRVVANEAAHRKSTRRIWSLAGFVLFAFLALAFVVQRNIADIEHSNDELRTQRYESCLGGVIIIQRFNAQQDELASIEALNTVADPRIRARRVHAYESARILPVPTCGPPPPGFKLRRHG